MRRAGVLLVLAVTACVESRAVPCGDDLVCAEGTVCSELTPAMGLPVEHRCVRPAQLDACAGHAAGDACDGVSDGRCYPRLLPPDDTTSDELVCMAAGCGNGRVDDGEQCDDLNAVSGDGCSADCRSNETCGNGVTDVAAGEQCDGGNLRAHDGCSPTCTLEVPRWTRLRFGNPGPRRGHTWVATDRGRAVLFGGGHSDGLLDDTWEWDGQGWREAFPSFHPTARAHHMSAFDPVRHRVVVFGGAQDGRVWEWDGTRWAAFAPPNRPPMTSDGAMAYDPSSGHIVLFGGIEAKASADPNPPYVSPVTYEWHVDGVDGSWTLYPQTNGTGNLGGEIPAQAGHVMATDPMRGKVVLVGHVASSAGIEQTSVWEYAGAGVWMQAAFGGPPIREHATLAYDPRLGELVLSGGTAVPADGTGPLHDAWAWNGSQWSLLCDDCGAPRAEHATAYDPVHGLVTFGGVASSGETDTAYELQVVDAPKFAWSALTIVDPPGNTAGGVAVTDRRAACMIMLHGGGEMLALSTSGWTAPTAAPPFSTRSDASLVYDPIHQQDVLFGGIDGGLKDETFTLTRQPDGTWTWQLQLPAPGETVPAARAKHAAAWLGDRMVMFGGNDGTKLDELWTWNGTWARVPPSSPWPAARDGQAMASDPDHHQVVMFGGAMVDGEPPGDDTWVWNGTAWTQLDLATHPSRRTGAAIARDPGTHQLILFGGDGGGGTDYDDTWVFDGAAWHLLDLDRTPPARAGHALVPSPDGRGVILFGGAGTSKDVWRLRWESGAPDESCTGYDDGDGDGARGCADDDCWATCAPVCPPETSCPDDAPGCGDGVRDPIESCRTCPADYGACPTVCGDLVCDPGETCPGDCP